MNGHPTAMRTASDLRRMLRGAADRAAAYPYRRWGFGEAVAMLGLLAASRATGDVRYRSVVEAAFDGWWAARGGTLRFEDHVAPGVPLLWLARREPRWMPVARALGRLYTRFPVRRGVPIHRPDLAALHAHVWVDCLYTDGPFLALLSRMTGEARWRDLADAHTRAYLEALWDAPRGLFWHGYDAGSGRANGVHWARGNGWALLGLLDLLRFLPPGHALSRYVTGIIERQVDMLLGTQDSGGHWHTVADDPRTYLESSVAAMMAWGLAQARRLGAVPAASSERVGRAADLALGAALAATDADGNLTGVSEATPAGDPDTYASRRTGVFPWGQGPLLLALADRIAPDGLWEGLS